MPLPYSTQKYSCILVVTSIPMYTLLSEQKMPEGSWKCEKCNNINYPFRTKCNRQNCGADKPSETKKSPSPTPDETDQVCCVANFCIFISFVKLLLFLVRYVHITIFNILSSELSTMDQLKRLPFSLPFIRWFRSWFLPLAFKFCYPHSIALFNLKLSTVPVSTRTCLRVEKVQHCSIWVSESQSCRRPHVAAVVKLLYLLVIVSSCCINCYGIYGLCGSYNALCQASMNLARILQVGSGF